MAAGYDQAFIEDYLSSNADSYNHPNAAIEPRIPGIFQYYSRAEDELVKGPGQRCASAQEIARRHRGGLEEITDRIGRENQIALYKALARHVSQSRPIRCASRAGGPLSPCSGSSRDRYPGCAASRTPPCPAEGRLERALRLHAQDCDVSTGDLSMSSPTSASPTAASVRAGLIRGIVPRPVLVAGAQTLTRWAHRSRDFIDWQPTCSRYILWCVLPVRRPGSDPWRAGQAAAVRAASGAADRVAHGHPDPARHCDRVLALEPLVAVSGPRFDGLGNIERMLSDPFYWNALGNMVWYCLAILVEYAIAFGLALLLNAQIQARSFFRVAFLLPLMLSPVAVVVDDRQVHARVPLRAACRSSLERSGWRIPPSSPAPSWRTSTMWSWTAWIFIPFMMIMLLAGLQALPSEVVEAARVDGAIRVAELLGHHLPADAAGIRHRDRPARHLRAQVGRHRAGRHRGWPRWRDRHAFAATSIERVSRAQTWGMPPLLAMVFLIIVVVSVTLLLTFAGLKGWLTSSTSRFSAERFSMSAMAVDHVPQARFNWTRSLGESRSTPASCSGRSFSSFRSTGP